MYYQVQYHGSGWRTWCVMSKPEQAAEMIEMLKRQGQNRVRINRTRTLTKSEGGN